MGECQVVTVVVEGVRLWQLCDGSGGTCGSGVRGQCW
jgi:hypothetical protein